MTQRALTSTEVADFLLRHPLTAYAVVQTQKALAIFGYAVYATVAGWEGIVTSIEGIMPLDGLQVEDASYGLVTVFAAADGVIRFSGWSKREGDIDKGTYTPPPFEQGVFDDILKLGRTVVVVVAIAAGLYLGVQLIQAWRVSRG